MSAVGLGCWAIGGPYWVIRKGERTREGWGHVEDAESVRAIRHALDLGITFFDTAPAYGAGRSERVLGEALGTRRSEAVISTKFGPGIDEATHTADLDNEVEMSLAGIRASCESSLRRLRTDYIDLYLLHAGSLAPGPAEGARDALEALVAEGKIRFYGWSTDDPERARIFAAGDHCTAVEHLLNVLNDRPEMLAVCDEHDLASVNKSPLGSGVLTGTMTPDRTFDDGDSRRVWDMASERLVQRREQLARLRPVLTADGRSMSQAAIGWILSRSSRTIPIPGFKRVEQVQEHARAAALPLFGHEQMEQIARLAGPA